MKEHIRTGGLVVMDLLEIYPCHAQNVNGQNVFVKSNQDESFLSGGATSRAMGF